MSVTVYPAQIAPMQILSVLGWTLCALGLGCATALAGLPILLAGLAVILIALFSYVAAKLPSQVMVASVCTLALCPFSLGLRTGVLPKIFGDEMLLLLYCVVLLPLYLVTDRVWRRGFNRYFALMAAFVMCQLLSLFVRTDLISFRNLLETYILGPLLLIVFLQETSNADRDELLINAVVWIVAVLAVLSIVERVLQRNPLLENLELEAGYQYLSPRIVALTEGVYRPYVTFFHPSEAGTFMALGLPFAIRKWMHKRSWVSACTILLIVAGLGVNATRGVWVAAAAALLLIIRNPVRTLFTALIGLGFGSLIAYTVLKQTAFMQRVTDLNNLFGRFIYWQLGMRVFADHMLLGVGHMQFQKVYLDYVQDVNQLVRIDLTQIYVMDNAYLTTLVEHGLIGLVALLGLLIATGVLLRGFHTKLIQEGLLKEASLVRSVQMALVVYVVSGLFADVNQFTKASKLLFILVGVGLGAAARSLSRNETSLHRVPFVPEGAV